MCCRAIGSANESGVVHDVASETTPTMLQENIFNKINIK